MGLMDISAGLLLVANPGLVLKMFDMAPATSDLLVLLSWVGVLIGSVGLSYLITLVNRFMGKTVWVITALQHALAAVMVIWQVENECLPGPWLMMALGGILVAVVQVAVVRLGWWSSVPREQAPKGPPSGYDNRISTRA